MRDWTCGGGKSTLIRCIAGLEKLDSGQILLDGAPCKPLGKHGGQQKVGMVFQSLNLFNNMTVLENCMVGQIKVLKKNKQKDLGKKKFLFPKNERKK